MATRRITRTNRGPSALVQGLVRTPTQVGQPTGPNAKPVTVDELLRLVLGGAELTLNIPKDASLEAIEGQMETFIHANIGLNEALERVKPIIGRFLLEVAERRLFRPKYRNITAYIVQKIEGEFKMSRNSAFEALRIARGYPSMTLEEFKRYGASRLLESLKLTDERDPKHTEILDLSTRMTVLEFREHVKQARETAAGEPTTFVLSLRLPVAWEDPWQELLSATGFSAADLFMEVLDSYVKTHGTAATAPATAANAPVHALTH